MALINQNKEKYFHYCSGYDQKPHFHATYGSGGMKSRRKTPSSEGLPTFWQLRRIDIGVPFSRYQKVVAGLGDKWFVGGDHAPWNPFRRVFRYLLQVHANMDRICDPDDTSVSYGYRKYIFRRVLPKLIVVYHYGFGVTRGSLVRFMNGLVKVLSLKAKAPHCPEGKCDGTAVKATPKAIFSLKVETLLYMGKAL